MNFSGYIPLRRGLISHIQDGRLSNNEALTFITLLMLADSSTGSGTINAPALRTFLPELSYDAAKRALLALEEKRYIFRAITPFSTRVYRFWVGGYRPTTGKYKSLQTDISKALETRDVNDINYVKSALDGAPEGALETALEGAPNYKKEKNKKKKTNPIEPTVCASESDSVCSSLSDTVERNAQRTLGSACAPHDATHDAQQCALHDATHIVHQTVHHGMHHGTTHAVQQANNMPSPEEVGMKWSGYDGAYIDLGSGRVLGWLESETRLGRGTAKCN